MSSPTQQQRSRLLSTPFHKYADVQRYNHSLAVVAPFRAARASKRFRIRERTSEVVDGVLSAKLDGLAVRVTALSADLQKLITLRCRLAKRSFGHIVRISRHGPIPP